MRSRRRALRAASFRIEETRCDRAAQRARVSARRKLVARGDACRRASASRLFALFFEMAEDRAGVDAEIAGGLRAVATVEREHAVDVLALPRFAGFGERQDQLILHLRALRRFQIQVLRLDLWTL